MYTSCGVSTGHRPAWPCSRSRPLCRCSPTNIERQVASDNQIQGGDNESDAPIQPRVVARIVRTGNGGHFWSSRSARETPSSRPALSASKCTLLCSNTCWRGLRSTTTRWPCVSSVRASIPISPCRTWPRASSPLRKHCRHRPCLELPLNTALPVEK